MNKTKLPPLCAELARIREANGWTLREMATRGGLTAASLPHRWETGSMPQRARLRDVARAYGLTLPQVIALWEQGR